MLITAINGSTYTTAVSYSHTGYNLCVLYDSILISTIRLKDVKNALWDTMQFYTLCQ